jgi:ADP-heptose:LPS heptosyltransferase
VEKKVMKLLFAPYARKLRDKAGPNPKDYPYAKELVQLLEQEGYEVVQIGCAGEEQICKEFLQNKSFNEVTNLLNEFDTFISVDSYLSHHSWFIGKKGIVIWGSSWPQIYGHDIHINLLKDKKYLRQEPYNIWEAVDPTPEAFVSPEEVLKALKENF